MGITPLQRTPKTDVDYDEVPDEEDEEEEEEEEEKQVLQVCWLNCLVFLLFCLSRSLKYVHFPPEVAHFSLKWLS